MARSVRAAKIGYARVSTLEQKLDAQLDALKRAGGKKIFSDRLGGMSVTRPGWEQLLAYVRPGDTLIVTELSRMSRSLVHLLEVVKECEAHEIELIALREKIDTTTAAGRAFLAIMGAIAQMERELKAERTAAGRAAAKAHGRTSPHRSRHPRTSSDLVSQL